LEEAKKNSTSNAESVSQNKLNYEKRKQLERDIRKITNQIQKAEKSIEQLEKSIKEKDEVLSNPEKYKDIINYDELYVEYELLNEKLKTEMNRWEEMNMKLEELRNG
jgi:ATP-binding cassette subfamily F protein 3